MKVKNASGQQKPNFTGENPAAAKRLKIS